MSSLAIRCATALTVFTHFVVGHILSRVSCGKNNFSRKTRAVYDSIEREFIGLYFYLQSHNIYSESGPMGKFSK